MAIFSSDVVADRLADRAEAYQEKAQQGDNELTRLGDSIIANTLMEVAIALVGSPPPELRREAE